MTTNVHRLFILTLTIIAIVVTAYIIYIGSSYYSTSLEERFYHPDNNLLKPNGLVGHGYGIIGTLMILAGVIIYMARKRYRFLSRFGLLKHWLEFHIFLCSLGSILILFHTAFKLGGIVAVSFWSMVAVVASGVIGRFIYLQIPRSIQGKELDLNEIRDLQNKSLSQMNSLNIDYSKINIHKEIEEIIDKNRNKPVLIQGVADRIDLIKLNGKLIKEGLEGIRKQIISNCRKEISMNRKLHNLTRMQRLFRYWHIAHLPFALIMLIIMIIHVAIAITFGYKWIF